MHKHDRGGDCEQPTDEELNSWDLNIFKFNTHGLMQVLLRLFDLLGLVTELQIDPAVLQRWVRAVIDRYGWVPRPHPPRCLLRSAPRRSAGFASGLGVPFTVS